MPIPPGAEPPKPVEPSSAGIFARIAETTKVIFTVTDQMARLAKEDERSQTQIAELTKLVFSVTKDSATLMGQMQNIEKRLEDREKLMEMTIAVRVREEVEKGDEELETTRGLEALRPTWDAIVALAGG